MQTAKIDKIDFELHEVFEEILMERRAGKMDRFNILANLLEPYKDPDGPNLKKVKRALKKVG